MIFHGGNNFQTRRGIGNLFSDLYCSVIKSNIVQELSDKALEHGVKMAKNMAMDIMSGTEPTEAASNQLKIAKKRIHEAIIKKSGVKRKKKKKKGDSDEEEPSSKVIKKSKYFDLFDD